MSNYPPGVTDHDIEQHFGELCEHGEAGKCFDCDEAWFSDCEYETEAGK